MSLGLLNVDPCSSDFKGKLNHNFEILDAIFPRSVMAVVTDLPLSPENQDIYILDDDGEFSIQIWDGEQWQYLELQEGVIYYVENENNFLFFDGVSLAYLFSGEDINIGGLPHDSDIQDEDYLIYSKDNFLKKITAAELATYINSTAGEAGVIPTGVSVPFFGDSNSVPSGFLLCNGSEVSRSVYAPLFAVIGTSCGAGNGSTTFNLPDIRARGLRMVSYDSSRDPDAEFRTAGAAGGNTGNQVGSVQEDKTKMPNNSFFISNNGGHSHTLNYKTSGGSGGADANFSVSSKFGNFDSNNDKFTSNSGSTAARSGFVNSVGSHSHTIFGGDNQTVGANIYCNYIIKT